MVCCRIGLGPSWGILRWVPRGIDDRTGPKFSSSFDPGIKFLGQGGGSASPIPHPRCWNKTGGVSSRIWTCWLTLAV